MVGRWRDWHTSFCMRTHLMKDCTIRHHRRHRCDPSMFRCRHVHGQNAGLIKQADRRSSLSDWVWKNVLPGSAPAAAVFLLPRPASSPFSRPQFLVTLPWKSSLEKGKLRALLPFPVDGESRQASAVLRARRSQDPPQHEFHCHELNQYVEQNKPQGMVNVHR